MEVYRTNHNYIVASLKTVDKFAASFLNPVAICRQCLIRLKSPPKAAFSSIPQLQSMGLESEEQTGYRKTARALCIRLTQNLSSPKLIEHDAGISHPYANEDACNLGKVPCHQILQI